MNKILFWTLIPEFVYHIILKAIKKEYDIDKHFSRYAKWVIDNE